MTGLSPLLTALALAHFLVPSPANCFVSLPNSVPSGLTPFVPLLLLRVSMRLIPPMASPRTPLPFPRGLTPFVPLKLCASPCVLSPPLFHSLCHSEQREESLDNRLALLSLAVQVKRCQLPTREILRSSSASALNDRAFALLTAPTVLRSQAPSPATFSPGFLSSPSQG